MTSTILVLCGCGSDSPSGPTEQPEPNIIVILTDDQRFDEVAFLPNLRSRVAERGTTFSNAFVTTPLCSPSRASIFRGQYAHNHRVTVGAGFVNFRTAGLERSTIATWLQDKGYRTGFFGKYMNGYGDNGHADWDYVPPGWDEWYGVVSGRATGSRYYNLQLNENGTLVSYSGVAYYEADLLARKAADFLGRTVSADVPFFMFVSVFAPHRPAHPAPRHNGVFANLEAPRLPSFNEADMSDKPQRYAELPLLTDAEIAEIDSLYRRRLASLQAVDELLALLVDSLEAQGLRDNTYIIFTSDNGYHLGEHRLKPGKSLPYEEDLRVPLIMSGPRVAHGATRGEMVLNIDLAPTIAEIAGVPVPDFVDGRSIMQLLEPKKLAFLLSPWRQSFIAEHWQLGEVRGLVPSFQAIRTSGTVYSDWSSGDRELYDLHKDPYQMENLAGTTAYRESWLSDWLDLLRACKGATCRAVEAQPFF